MSTPVHSRQRGDARRCRRRKRTRSALKRTRVFVLRSRLLRDIVAAISAEHSDIEVLDDVVDLRTARLRLRSGEAAVLICPEAAEADMADLLYDHPRLRVLVVEDGGHASFLWELFPLKRPLGELGLDCLLEAIRGD